MMLSLDNLTCYLPGKNAAVFKNINMQVKAGQCTLLCGQSGCGKTTLLKVMAGVIPEFLPANVEGAVYVQGTNITGQHLYTIGKKIGMVFQDCRSQFFMSHVVEELLFAADNYQCEENILCARLEHLIQLMQLEKLLTKNLFSLSSGERQRVAIASVAAYAPNVMLFDEPSANLDPQGLQCLAALLRELKSQGVAILIADHRIQFLAGIVDSSYLMRDGQLHSIDLSTDQVWHSSLPRFSQCTPQPVEMIPVAGRLVSLVLDSVSFARKGRCVLDNIHAHWDGGGVIAITGGNGEGKTTLLRVLCGLTAQSSGSILINNKTAKPAARLRQHAVVMQDPDYQLFTASVREEIYLSCPNVQDAEPIISALGLAPLLEAHPGTLSLGEKQRVLIATALISNKDILLFDEPTSGMDRERTAQLACQIKSCARQHGKLVVIVTHDEFLIQETKARVFNLENGCLVKVARDSDIQEYSHEKYN